MTAGPDSASPRRWLAIAVLLAAAACGDAPTGAVPDCGEGAAIAVDGRVEGTLVQGDDRFAGGLVDYYSLQLPYAARLTTALTSTELSPLLLVFDADGDVVDQAFDPYGAPDGVEETAHLTRELAAGCHLLGASSWTPGQTGAYTLTVVDADDE